MTIGENMRQLREECGYTLKQVEKATGVDNGNLSRYERDINYPSIELCIRLADLYNVSLDELVGRTNQALMSKSSYSTPSSQLSIEDKNLLSAYHDLERSLQSLLWDMIFNWQKNSTPSSEEMPKNKDKGNIL